MRTFVWTASLVAIALTQTGCGSSNTVWVTGKVVKGGAPYVAPEGQTLHVTFLALEAKDATGKAVTTGEPFPAQVNAEDGTFSIPGADGSGIAPGKYQVSITQTPKPGTQALPKNRKGTAPDRDADAFNGKFSATDPKSVVEIGATRDVILDLDSLGQATPNPNPTQQTGSRVPRDRPDSSRSER